MSYTLTGAYSQKLKKLTLSGTKKLLFALNRLGAKVDIEKSKTLVVHCIVLEDGTKINCGNRFQCRVMLKTLDDLFNLNIDVNKSSLTGAIYNVYFKEDVFDKLFPEKSQKVSNKEDKVENLVELEVEKPEPEPEPDVDPEITQDNSSADADADEINWGYISSPTFGKKNLIILAEKHGVTLDMNMKYREMVDTFKKSL